MNKYLFVVLCFSSILTSHIVVSAERYQIKKEQKNASGKHKKRRRRRRRNAEDATRAPSPTAQLRSVESTESLPELNPVESMKRNITVLENTVYCSVAPEAYQTSAHVKKLTHRVCKIDKKVKRLTKDLALITQLLQEYAWVIQAETSSDQDQIEQHSV